MRSENPHLKAFSSVLIIGAAGQTGQLFLRSLNYPGNGLKIIALVKEGQLTDFKKKFPDVEIYSDLTESLKSKPEAIIIAMANPVDEILQNIGSNAKYDPVIILPQNGVEVVPVAQKIMTETKRNWHLIRASLFTVISMNDRGEAEYKKNKLRIALAAVKNPGGKMEKNESVGISENLEKARGLFESGGFAVKIFDDYKSVEWTKLVVNSLGSSAVITGLTPRETFQDAELFKMEASALKDRMEIMQAAGIPFAQIPWSNVSLLPILKFLPTGFLLKFRRQFAEMVSRGRDNQPPAAGRKIQAGKPTEMKYYHQPFVDLASLHGLKSYLDETILDIISEQETGKINLAAMDSDEKLKLLFEVYKKYLQKPFIPRNPIMTGIVQKITNFFGREVKIIGRENLEAVRESLNRGKSVMLLANHSSHADHPVLVRMLRDSGFGDLAERIIFIAGMKFKNETIAKLFSDGYARVVVSTPTNEPQTEEENRQAQQINLKGFLKINKLLNKGNLLVLYPEGTRSRDNKLLKAIPSVARYFENQNINYLLPVAIQGTAELLPVGRTVPRFAKTVVTIGKPIEPSILIKKINESLPEDVKNAAIKDKNLRGVVSERTIDAVMKRIALLLPEKQRGYYS